MKQWIKKHIQTYEYRINFDRYWKRRICIQNLWGGIYKSYLLFWLKRQESKFGATTGTGFGTKESPCCQINVPLSFPHGLSGIVFARNVVFEGNATIYQHVTIAEEDKRKITYIGKNVDIGAGAVILNNARIGQNVKIGANAVVTCDVEDGCIVAGVPARVIKRELANEDEQS